jgi:hypothetical protein
MNLLCTEKGEKRFCELARHDSGGQFARCTNGAQY